MDQGKKAQNKKESADSKRFISIYWRCCHVYSRVYRNSQGTHYVGQCPRCRAQLKVPIGEGGTSQRMFIAS